MGWYRLQEVHGHGPHELEHPLTDAAVFGVTGMVGLLAGASLGLAVVLVLLARAHAEARHAAAAERERDVLLESTAADRALLQEVLAWQEMVRNALDVVPDWVVRVGPRNEVLESNRPRESPLKVPDCEGVPLPELYPPKLQAALVEHLDRVRRAGKPLSMELTHAGGKSWAESRFYPLPFGEVLVVTRDLTEQKAKERLLHRSKERYALAVQGANDGLWDWNLETDQVYWSYAWKHMMGVDDGEATGTPRDWFDRVHPDDLPGVKAALDAHLDGAANRYESEHRVRLPNGDWLWVLARGMALRDSQGRPRRIAGSLTDLTNRRVVAVTQEKANLLEHATHAVGVGIALLQPDGTLTRPSEVLQRMAGSWATLSQWWSDVRGAVTASARSAPCRHCREPEKHGTELAEVEEPGTGAPRVFELTLAGHAHEISHSSAHVLLVKDVTDQVLATRGLHRLNEELVLARDQALAASRAKSAFLANMSHELRTPLNHILGYTEMILEELQDGGQDDLAADLAKVHTSGVHLLDLISGILDLSKIEAGLAGLQIRTFAVEPLLTGLLEAARPEAERRGNRLILAPCDDLPAMTADPGPLERILANLLSNAVKFTQGGEVRLEVRKTERSGRPWLIFRVTDTGVGMTAEQLARVAEHFYMGDSSSTRQTGGVGLGLTLVWRFTDMMGGSVAVDSRPGEGSTFEVALPVEVQPLA